MTIFVVGNATVDHCFEVDRLPVPGETRITKASHTDAGGKGLNQAIAASRTGASVSFIGPVGNDAGGKLIRSRLADERVDFTGVKSIDSPSDQSIIFVDPAGENMIVSTAYLSSAMEPNDIAEPLSSIVAGDTLLLQGNLSFETTRHCLALGHQKDARTIMNPAPITFDYTKLWQFIDTVIFNEVECRVLTGERPELGVESLRRYGVDTIIVTLGAKGAMVVSDNTSWNVFAPEMKVVDSTGAGDVFCGVLCAGLSLGMSIDHASRYATHAASLSVTRRGTASSIPTMSELSSIKKALF